MAAISRQNPGKVKRARTVCRDGPEPIKVLNHRGKKLTTKLAPEKTI
jgi:hypothetical protein